MTRTGLRTLRRASALLLFLLGLTLLALATLLAAQGAWAGLALVPLGLVFVAAPLLALRALLRVRRLGMRLGHVRADARPQTVLAGAPLQVELVVRPGEEVALAARACLEGAHVDGRRARQEVELQARKVLRRGVEVRLAETIQVPFDAWASGPGAAWSVCFELDLDGQSLRIGDVQVVVVRSD